MHLFWPEIYGILLNTIIYSSHRLSFQYQPCTNPPLAYSSNCVSKFNNAILTGCKHSAPIWSAVMPRCMESKLPMLKDTSFLKKRTPCAEHTKTPFHLTTTMGLQMVSGLTLRWGCNGGIMRTEIKTFFIHPISGSDIADKANLSEASAGTRWNTQR